MRGKEVFYPMGWDDNGLPTERRVQNYFGVRCDPSLPYDPTFTPPEKPDKQPISVSRPNFIELCDEADRRRREGVRAAVALSRPVGRLVDDLRDDRPRRAARVADDVPAPPRASSWRIRSKRRRCGTWTSAPRWRRPSSRIASSRARTTGFISTGSRIGLRAAVAIETTRPELIPACVALVAHPDDERYQPLFGTEVDHAALRRARAGQGACAGRSRKGQRHRDDLHLRRHHRRDVVARAEAAGARDRAAERHTRTGDVGTARLGVGRRRARAGRLRSAGRAVGEEGAGEDRRAAARERRSAGRSEADHAQREVLREGRSPARDHHQPPVVHQDDRPSRGLHHARPRDQLASGIHAGPLRELGQRPERRLVHQPPALLRRAVPGVVSDSRRRQRRLRECDRAAGIARCRSIRRRTCPTATPPISAASRAASSAIPTSWTRGRPRRCRRSS